MRWADLLEQVKETDVTFRRDGGKLRKRPRPKSDLGKGDQCCLLSFVVTVLLARLVVPLVGVVLVLCNFSERVFFLVVFGVSFSMLEVRFFFFFFVCQNLGGYNCID